MKIEIGKIKIAKRIRKEVRDLDELVESIRNSGQITPISVMGIDGGEFQLLAGLRRIRAMETLGETEIDAKIFPPCDAESALLMEFDENVKRRDFTLPEKMEIAETIAVIERTKARQRMLAGKNVEQTDPCANPRKGRQRTDAVVSEKIGMKETAYRQARYLANNAPEMLKRVDDEEIALNAAYEEVRAEKKKDEPPKAKPALPKKDVPSEMPKPITSGVAELPRRELPTELAAPTLPVKAENAADSVAVFDMPEADADTPVADESFPGADEETENAEPPSEEDDAPPVEQTPAEAMPEKPKKSAAQRRVEKYQGGRNILSPKDMAAAQKLADFAAMSDKEKVADLQRQLHEERARTADAMSELSKLKDIHHNIVMHSGATIESQEKRIEQLIAALNEVCAERDALKSALEGGNK